jgi:hypothetical protein
MRNLLNLTFTLLTYLCFILGIVCFFTMFFDLKFIPIFFIISVGGVASSYLSYYYSENYKR